MRVANWLRSPSSRRSLLVAAVLCGCFMWTMVIFGLSVAMVERGIREWWLMPVFGLLALALATWAARGVGTSRRWAEVTPGLPPAAPRQVPVSVKRVLPEPLSAREAEVLQQLAVGRTNQEIAKALFIAPGTVKAHLNHIFRKLEAASRLQAVAHAREAGLLDPPQ